MARILIIPSWYSTIQNPHAGIFFIDYIREISRFHEIDVLYCNPIDIRRAVTSKSGDVPLHILPNEFYTEDYFFFPRLHLINSTLFTRCGLTIYHKYNLERKKYDIIHALSCVWAGKLAMSISRLDNTPYIISEHASFFLRKIIKGSAENEANIAFLRAKKVTAVSQYILDNLKIKLPDAEIIPNYISKEFENNKDYIGNERGDDSKIRVLYVANVNENKRIDVALEGFMRFNEYFANSVLNIIGIDSPDNKYVSKYKKQIEYGKINLLGKISRAEIMDAMLKSDIYVLTSNHETFSISILEAASLGIPIVTTRCGGPEEVLKGTRHIFINIGSADELKNALINISGDFKKKKNDAIVDSKIIRERYTRDTILQRYNDIYLNIQKERLS